MKLTITPDEGYQLDVLTVNEEPATLTDDSFVMPATDVMLAATFKTGGVGIEKDEADFIRMWTSNATLYVVLPQQTSVMIAGTDGRILVRESGTEPVIRVMVEAATDEICEKYVNSVVKVIEDQGLTE